MSYSRGVTVNQLAENLGEHPGAPNNMAYLVVLLGVIQRLRVMAWPQYGQVPIRLECS